MIITIHGYLHPTMYLLIHSYQGVVITNTIYLHPTMYLLILYSTAPVAVMSIRFTSHYVSINSSFVQFQQI